MSRKKGLGTITVDQVLDSVLRSTPGASTIDDLLHAQHPADTVEDPNRRSIDRMVSVVVAGYFGPPLGIPWRLGGGAQPPCDPGLHAWEPVEEHPNPAVRNFVLGSIRKARIREGAVLCRRCWHAFLPGDTGRAAP